MSSKRKDFGVAIALRPQYRQQIEEKGWQFFNATELPLKIRVGEKYEVLCQDLHTYHVSIRAYNPLNGHGSLHFVHWDAIYDYDRSFHSIYLTEKGRYSKGIDPHRNTYPESGSIHTAVTPQSDLKRPFSAFSHDSSEDEEDEVQIVTKPKRLKQEEGVIQIQSPIGKTFEPTLPPQLPQNKTQDFAEDEEEFEDEQDYENLSSEYEDKPSRGSSRYGNNELQQPQKQMSKRSCKSTYKRDITTSKVDESPMKMQILTGKKILPSSNSESVHSEDQALPTPKTERRIFNKSSSSSPPQKNSQSNAVIDLVTPVKPKSAEIQPTFPQVEKVFRGKKSGRNSKSNSNNKSQVETPVVEESRHPFDVVPEQLSSRINEEIRTQRLWGEMIQLLFRDKTEPEMMLKMYENREVRKDLLDHIKLLMTTKFEIKSEVKGLTNKIAETYKMQKNNKVSPKITNSPLQLIKPLDTTPDYIANIHHAFERTSSTSSSSNSSSSDLHIVTPSTASSDLSAKQYDLIRYVNYMLNIPHQMHLTARLLQDVTELKQRKSELASCDHNMMDRVESLLQNLLDSLSSICHE